MRLWMVFMLWIAVGFDRYRAGSERLIYIALGCGLLLADSLIQCNIPAVAIIADKKVSIF
jgi:hypothetical protein